MVDDKGTANQEGRRDAAQVARRSGTSFYWAMRFLPEPKRSSMFAVYAFCRVVDDIADGSADEFSKREQLARYRDDLSGLYAAGSAELREVHDLTRVIDRYKLAQADFEAIIDGMETDAAPRVRIANQVEFDRYVDRVACAVGRLCCPIFGLPDDVHRPVSGALGTALQITNILRDLREDAARDRVYLPQDQLSLAGLSDLEALDLVDQPDLEPVCDPLVSVAEAAFARAASFLDDCSPEAAKPARMMGEAYRRLFLKVRQAGFAPLPRQRVRLGKREKLAVMLRHGVLGIR